MPLLSSRAPSRTILQVLLVGLGFIAGYFIAERWWSSGGRSTLVQICGWIDYINGLQEELEGQRAASEEVRDEFMAMLQQYRRTIGSPAEERD
jgi:hypothetical protein